MQIDSELFNLETRFRKLYLEFVPLKFSVSNIIQRKIKILNETIEVEIYNPSRLCILKKVDKGKVPLIKRDNEDLENKLSFYSRKDLDLSNEEICAFSNQFSTLKPDEALPANGQAWIPCDISQGKDLKQYYTLEINPTKFTLEIDYDKFHFLDKLDRDLYLYELSHSKWLIGFDFVTFDLYNKIKGDQYQGVKTDKPDILVLNPTDLKTIPSVKVKCWYFQKGISTSLKKIESKELMLETSFPMETKRKNFVCLSDRNETTDIKAASLHLVLSNIVKGPIFILNNQTPYITLNSTKSYLIYEEKTGESTPNFPFVKRETVLKFVKQICLFDKVTFPTLNETYCVGNGTIVRKKTCTQKDIQDFEADSIRPDFYINKNAQSTAFKQIDRSNWNLYIILEKYFLWTKEKVNIAPRKDGESFDEIEAQFEAKDSIIYDPIEKILHHSNITDFSNYFQSIKSGLMYIFHFQSDNEDSMSVVEQIPEYYFNGDKYQSYTALMLKIGSFYLYTRPNNRKAILVYKWSRDPNFSKNK